jgi:hypothetical protein
MRFRRISLGLLSFSMSCCNYEMKYKKIPSEGLDLFLLGWLFLACFKSSKVGTLSFVVVMLETLDKTYISSLLLNTGNSINH